MARFEVTIKHPLGGERVAEYSASSTATAPTVAKGIERIWAEQVCLDTVRPVLYRIVDSFPYLEREDEYTNLTLEEAAARIEDLTPVSADLVISDVEDGVDWPMVYDDPETNRTVTMTREVG